MIFSGCINMPDGSISPQSAPKANISSSNYSPNTSSLRMSNTAISATKENKIALGPYVVRFTLDDFDSYDIQKSGPINLTQSGNEGPSFQLYQLNISNNQSFSIIVINIQRYLPDMNRKTSIVEKNIKYILSDAGYEDITVSRRLFGSRSGALGVGRSDKYETIFAGIYWNSDHSCVTIIGNLPEPAMNTFFESIKIDEYLSRGLAQDQKREVKDVHGAQANLLTHPGLGISVEN
jgi:hypothetical protein